jgi:phosphotriesterase-related protein
MSKTINTVTGPITPDMLGQTAMHEHFFFEYPGCAGDLSSGKHVTKEQIIDAGVAAAKLMLEQGYSTVVDVTPNDTGNNPEWLKEISERSGIQIISCTGFYIQEICGSGYWGFRSRIVDAVSEIEELMTIELTEGWRGTGIKAGVIKVATGSEIRDYENMFLIAGARAQRKTGAVIITHTENGKFAVEQGKFLLEHGALPEKTVIGHMCGNLDPDLHTKVMEMGFSVNLDHVGAYIFNQPSDEERIVLIKELINRGFTDKIVLSQDAIAQYVGRPFEWPEEEKHDWRNYRFGWICEGFVPMMKAAGITDEQINMFMVENPKRIFS